MVLLELEILTATGDRDETLGPTSASSKLLTSSTRRGQRGLALDRDLSLRIRFLALCFSKEQAKQAATAETTSAVAKSHVGPSVWSIYQRECIKTLFFPENAVHA
ncbi:conserved hypothetical protein [Histoplasma capsulatum var. duboisii H88]|uniref:Uncharacterized protein n=1 Tax=Ajellomyces capsulatus (strain H88) TaxID=544711 RepID=F0UJQ3_AJEC8|nr:conserved hypothetical protein [Histoplasma capsulatum var. duboisii H88]